MKNKPIYVTQPSLPPLEEYTELLKEWPDVMAAWMAYLDTEFKPIVDKFLKNYINR